MGGKSTKNIVNPQKQCDQINPQKQCDAVILIDGNDKYRTYNFSYVKKEMYKSKIIIYDDVELFRDILLIGRCIPSKIIYGKLIADPANRRYVFLSSEMKLLYNIRLGYQFSKFVSYVALAYDEKMLLEESNNDSEDVREIYFAIKKDYEKLFILHCRRELIKHLPEEMIGIIIPYGLI